MAKSGNGRADLEPQELHCQAASALQGLQNVIHIYGEALSTSSTALTATRLEAQSLKAEVAALQQQHVEQQDLIAAKEAMLLAKQQVIEHLQSQLLDFQGLVQRLQAPHVQIAVGPVAAANRLPAGSLTPSPLRLPPQQQGCVHEEVAHMPMAGSLQHTLGPSARLAPTLDLDALDGTPPLPPSPDVMAAREQGWPHIAAGPCEPNQVPFPNMLPPRAKSGCTAHEPALPASLANIKTPPGGGLPCIAGCNSGLAWRSPQPEGGMYAPQALGSEEVFPASEVQAALPLGPGRICAPAAATLVAAPVPAATLPAVAPAEGARRQPPTVLEVPEHEGEQQQEQARVQEQQGALAQQQQQQAAMEALQQQQQELLARLQASEAHAEDSRRRMHELERRMADQWRLREADLVRSFEEQLQAGWDENDELREQQEEALLEAQERAARRWELQVQELRQQLYALEAARPGQVSAATSPIQHMAPAAASPGALATTTEGAVSLLSAPAPDHQQHQAAPGTDAAPGFDPDRLAAIAASLERYKRKYRQLKQYILAQRQHEAGQQEGTASPTQQQQQVEQQQHQQAVNAQLTDEPRERAWQQQQEQEVNAGAVPAQQGPGAAGGGLTSFDQRDVVQAELQEVVQAVECLQQGQQQQQQRHIGMDLQEEAAAERARPQEPRTRLVQRSALSRGYNVEAVTQALEPVAAAGLGDAEVKLPHQTRETSAQEHSKPERARMPEAMLRTDMNRQAAGIGGGLIGDAHQQSRHLYHSRQCQRQQQDGAMEEEGGDEELTQAPSPEGEDAPCQERSDGGACGTVWPARQQVCGGGGGGADESAAATRWLRANGGDAVAINGTGLQVRNHPDATGSGDEAQQQQGKERRKLPNSLKPLRREQLQQKLGIQGGVLGLVRPSSGAAPGGSQTTSQQLQQPWQRRQPPPQLGGETDSGDAAAPRARKAVRSGVDSGGDGDQRASKKRRAKGGAQALLQELLEEPEDFGTAPVRRRAPSQERPANGISSRGRLLASSWGAALGASSTQQPQQQGLGDSSATADEPQPVGGNGLRPQAVELVRVSRLAGSAVAAPGAGAPAGSGGATGAGTSAGAGAGPGPAGGADEPGYKYSAVVRGRARDDLQGVECASCRAFYEAVATWGASTAAMPTCGHALAAQQRQGAAGAGGPGGPPGQQQQHAAPGGAGGAMLGELQQHLRQVGSRHRFKYAPPATPEGFWDIGFNE